MATGSKPADQVLSSVAFADVSVIQAQISNGDRLVYKFGIFYRVGAAEDCRVALAGPAGIYIASLLAPQTYQSSSQTFLLTHRYLDGVGDANAENINGHGANVTGIILIRGSLIAQASGTLKLRMAKRAAGSGNLVIRQGSWMTTLVAQA